MLIAKLCKCNCVVRIALPIILDYFTYKHIPYSYEI